MYRIAKDIFAVGAQNPTMRVFDVVMHTEYGTTYNSYLIKDNKTALVEAVHAKFLPNLIYNIEEVIGSGSIDYLICNHAEPDHTGCIAELLKRYPDITLVGTSAAIKNITAITNTTFKSFAVKDGDTLSLGERTLKFISAPNLHWPDTMFTYLESDGIIFTCDFFGAHYGEADILDTSLKYPQKYWVALKEYFFAIMAPFKKFVRAGLAKVQNLNINMVATSHGPVLTEFFPKVKQLYEEWSRDITEPKSAAIVYVSAYCYTQIIAEEINRRLIDSGYKTYIFNVIESDAAEIQEAVEKSPLLLFGSPTINKDALKPVWDVINSMDTISNRGKTALTFGSYGWSGEACDNLNARLNGMGIKTPAAPIKIVFKPSESDIEEIGKKINLLLETLK